MATHDVPKFEAFADELNGAAPRDGLIRSVGFDTTTGQPASTIEQAKGKIDAVLARVGDLDHDTAVALRDVLASELDPLIKSDNGDQAKLSMIDLITVGLTTEAQIRTFLRAHGIDLNNASDLLYARSLFTNAVGYYDRNVARNARGKVHEELRNVKDPSRPKAPNWNDASDILLWFRTASGQERKILTPQACALLRIALVIDYLQRDLTVSELPGAVDALKKIVEPHIRRFNKDKALQYETGDSGDIAIPLTFYEYRLKPSDSNITKLLVKSSNRTDEVLDNFGLRFTTKSAHDAVRLIYQMFFHPRTRIFPSMNIRIKETTNKLIDEHKLVQMLSDPSAAQEFFSSIGTPTVMAQDELLVAGSRPGENPHSSAFYRALHLTFDFPFTRPDGKRVFVPVELQFLDIKSRIENYKAAPHEEYREGQLDQVRDRIGGNNLVSAYEARIDGARKKKR